MGGYLSALFRALIVPGRRMRNRPTKDGVGNLIRTLANSLKVVSIVLLTLAVAGGSVWFFNYWVDREQPQEVGRAVVLTISEEDDDASVAEKLQDDELITQPWYFENKMRLSNLELKPGTYNLRIGMSTTQILDIITVAGAAESDGEATTAAGPERPAFDVTFIEGQRIEENAVVLEQAGMPGAGAEYIELANDVEYWQDSYTFLADVPVDGSLEGFLFPSTYTIPGNATVASVIDYQLSTFEQTLTPEILSGYEAQGLSVYEAVVLASIVEREAAVAVERPSIAEVYLNRFNDDMNLNADPAQQYGLGTEANWWPSLNEDGNLEKSKETPYDTYLAENTGLPPGPIANPGSASLQAVAAPAADGYYYFVATGDCSGEHRFSVTYEEHQVAVEEEDPTQCL